MSNYDDLFPRYSDFNPKVAVWCVTPAIEGCFHRFFDTSPISPSGRYLALTKLPTEARLPAPDDVSEIALVDLQSGEATTVATTGCFDTQLGAQAQWGTSDSELYFNDLDWSDGTPRPVAVRLDPASGAITRLGGPVYMVSPDGKKLASPCLLRTSFSQPGYGAVVLPRFLPYNRQASTDDGIFITDTETGACELFISLRDIAEGLREELTMSFAKLGVAFTDYDLYGFHVKWTPKGDKLLFVVRARCGDTRVKLVNFVVTIDVATKTPFLAMQPDIWSRGGHHPQWHPDGQHVIMNLKYPENDLRFVQYGYDGSDLRVIAAKAFGGGHPSVHPNGRHILTDEYEHGDLAYSDGTTPIRSIHIDSGVSDEIVRIRTRPDYHARGRELRVDPHPAWDPTFRFAAFNACPNGKRQVFIADLSEMVT